MSKIDDYIKNREKELKEGNVDLGSTKFGRIYKKSLEEYNQFKKEFKKLTEEEKKKVKKYYIEQAVCIVLIVILSVILIIRIIHIKM